MRSVAPLPRTSDTAPGEVTPNGRGWACEGWRRAGSAAAFWSGACTRAAALGCCASATAALSTLALRLA